MTKKNHLYLSLISRNIWKRFAAGLSANTKNSFLVLSISIKGNSRNVRTWIKWNINKFCWSRSADATNSTQRVLPKQIRYPHFGTEKEFENVVAA